MIFFGAFGRSDSLPLRAEADQVGQEGPETFQIPLSIADEPVPPVAVFIAESAQIRVVDTSSK